MNLVSSRDYFFNCLTSASSFKVGAIHCIGLQVSSQTSRWYEVHIRLAVEAFQGGIASVLTPSPVDSTLSWLSGVLVVRLALGM